jgi:Tol biopolymer transport system component
MIVSPVEPTLVILQPNSTLVFLDLNTFTVSNIIKNRNISSQITFSADGKKILYIDTKNVLHIADSTTLDSIQ